MFLMSSFSCLHLRSYRIHLGRSISLKHVRFVDLSIFFSFHVSCDYTYPSLILPVPSCRLHLRKLRKGPHCFVVPVLKSYSSQFVLILVNSYRKILVNSYSFGQFVLMSGQFVLILVNSYSFWSIWSIRTHFGQFVLKLK